MEEAPFPELRLPGFRFHPTEEELVDFYLRNMLHGRNPPCDVIRSLDIYRHDPLELPGLARLGEREWYFFVPRGRQHGSSRGRPNRTTHNGFWKATGSDRKIMSLSDHRRVIGFRKTLVFYRGRAPRGQKTNWIMNEYRIPDNSASTKDVVLCKIYQKATSLKVLEQRAAMEEAIKISNQSSSSSLSMDTLPTYSCPDDSMLPRSDDIEVVLKQQEEEVVGIRAQEIAAPVGMSLHLKLPFGGKSLPELEVPRFEVTDWTQDGFWIQFNSPWLQNLVVTPPAHNLNFLAN
ncbi:hypothetical protein MLD38_026845 [Melastoma candidum]|uniref:Uncharacterized protein n=1 Tax=Melastoma candidum TaxID=119954 RepID=A0ACB9NZP1_9MYRT|nr:hypothetical protein MLD38_026845 [Melastoma candidum]